MRGIDSSLYVKEKFSYQEIKNEHYYSLVWNNEGENDAEKKRENINKVENAFKEKEKQLLHLAKP